MEERWRGTKSSKRTLLRFHRGNERVNKDGLERVEEKKRR